MAFSALVIVMKYYIFSAKKSDELSVSIPSKEFFLNPCPVCGLGNKEIEIVSYNTTILQRRKEWPDIINCGSSMIAMSERVKEKVELLYPKEIFWHKIHFYNYTKECVLQRKYYVCDFSKKVRFRIEIGRAHV